MPETSLEDVVGATINQWFGGSTIDVHATLDAMLAVMASIAVKAGCNTDERVATFAGHMKANLTIQLNRERALADVMRDRHTEVGPKEIEILKASANQAHNTEESVRAAIDNGSDIRGLKPRNSH